MQYMVEHRGDNGAQTSGTHCTQNERQKVNPNEKNAITKEIKGITLEGANDEEEDGKRGKLDMNTPVYHGRASENVEEWILMIRNGIRMANIPKKINAIKKKGKLKKIKDLYSFLGMVNYYRHYIKDFDNISVF